MHQAETAAKLADPVTTNRGKQVAIGDAVPAQIIEAFELEAASIVELNGGRTNRTWLVETKEKDLVLQSLSRDSHPDLTALMDNVIRVLNHLDWKHATRKLNAKLNQAADPHASLSDQSYEHWFPQMVPPKGKYPFAATENGEVWRAFSYKPGTVILKDSSQTSPKLLTEIAGLFGRFSGETFDLGGQELLESRPGFHNLDQVKKRCIDLLDNNETDAERRAQIAELFERADELHRQLDPVLKADGFSEVRQRVVHNDTKISNVIVDLKTETAVSVMDLDLVMMGPIWHDVGDLVRSVCWQCGTSYEPHVQLETIAAVFQGYANGIAAANPGWGSTQSSEGFEFNARRPPIPQALLSEAELETFAASGPRIALELAIRYFSDYLDLAPRLRVGAHESHLRRGKANLVLAESLLASYSELKSCLAN